MSFTMIHQFHCNERAAPNHRVLLLRKGNCGLTLVDLHNIPFGYV
jgi:hypothetical protein